MSYPTRDGTVTTVFYLKDDGTVVGVSHSEDPRLEELLKQFQESTPNLSAADREVADRAFKRFVSILLADR